VVGLELAWSLPGVALPLHRCSLLPAGRAGGSAVLGTRPGVGGRAGGSDPKCSLRQSGPALLWPRAACPGVGCRSRRLHAGCLLLSPRLLPARSKGSNGVVGARSGGAAGRHERAMLVGVSAACLFGVERRLAVWWLASSLTLSSSPRSSGSSAACLFGTQRRLAGGGWRRRCRSRSCGLRPLPVRSHRGARGSDSVREVLPVHALRRRSGRRCGAHKALVGCSVRRSCPRGITEHTTKRHGLSMRAAQHFRAFSGYSGASEFGASSRPPRLSQTCCAQFRPQRVEGGSPRLGPVLGPGWGSGMPPTQGRQELRRPPTEREDRTRSDSVPSSLNSTSRCRYRQGAGCLRGGDPEGPAHRVASDSTMQLIMTPSGQLTATSASAPRPAGLAGLDVTVQPPKKSSDPGDLRRWDRHEDPGVIS